MASARAVDWSKMDALHDGIAAPRLRVGHTEGEQVKRVAYDFNDRKRFPKPLPQVELIHLTDLQVGAKNFERKRFVEYREWMLSVPYRFGLLGGDLVDAATVLSIGNPYDNTKEPRGQVKEVVELLRPLADAGRLLASVGGNHERRTRATYGDCGADIAERLNVPYSCGVQLIDIFFGKHQPFTVAITHGKGNPRTKGAIAQMLDRFMGQNDSQLYFMGHVHNPLVLPNWRMRRVGRKIKLQKIMGVVSSSFLSYWNSYAEESFMSPSETMMGRAVLEPDGHWELTLK